MLSFIAKCLKFIAFKRARPSAMTLRHLDKFLYALVALVMFQATFAKFYCSTADYFSFLFLLLLSIVAWQKAKHHFSAQNWNKISVFLILIGAGLLRLAWIWIGRPENIGDQIAYRNFAIQIANGEILSDPWYTLGCSYFFALVIKLFGSANTTLHCALLFLALLQIYLLYKLTSALFGHGAGILAAACLSFYPEHIYSVTVINGDVLYATLTFASVFFILRLQQTNKWSYGMASAILLGLANGVRSTTILFLTAFFIWVLFFNDKSWLSKLKALSLYGIFFILGAAPFIFINFKTTGFLGMTPQQTGMLHLYIGLNPTTSGSDTMEEFKTYFKLLKEAPDDTSESNASYASRQLREKYIPERIKNHWDEILYMIFFRKPIKFWGHPMILTQPLEGSKLEDHEKWCTSFSFIYHRLILFLVFLTFWKLFRATPEDTPIFRLIALLILASTSFHMIFVVVPRYHHMFLALLVFCATVALLQPTKGINSTPAKALT